MIWLRLQQLILLVFVTYILALATVWTKVSRVLKITRKTEPELDSDTFVRLTSTKSNRNILRAIASSAQNMLSGRSSYDYHLALEDDVSDMKDVGTASGRRLHLSGLADWIEAPRDATNLPHIIQATKSQDPCEREYAFGEMLKVVERLDPLANIPLIDSALTCVVEWIRDRPVVERHVSMVLDPLPLLVDYASKHPTLRKHVDPMITYLIRELAYPAVTSNRAVFGVGVLLERGLIPQDALRNQIIPILFDLVESKGDDPGMEDRRVEIAAVLCRVVSSGMITDKRWLFDHFIADYSRFLEHHVVHIRKAAVAVLADLSRIFGQKFTELFIIPHLSYLCMDANWGVRKAVCEVFVEVARHASPNVRRVQLAQTFVKLLHDPSRWVWYTAFQELGPFIATFANSKLSGLKIKDGQVCESDGRCDSESVVADSVDFEKLPAGCCMPEKDTEEDDAEDSGQESDPREDAEQIIDGLQHMLDTWTAGHKKNSTRSAPPSVIEEEPSSSCEHVGIAAKCNSSDDLSKVGLDDDDFDDHDMDLLDTSMRLGLDESFGLDDRDDTKLAEPSSNVPEDFTPISYWADSYEGFADNDELVEFGSAKSVPSAPSFLERRYDVLYVSPERAGTPTASPRRSRNSHSSEADDASSISPRTCKTSRTLSGQGDETELFADCRGEDDLDNDESYEEDETQKIVPQELVDNFMGMVLPGGMMDSDINRHCAHNFPAVAYTLGRANWPQLRDTYNKLATDDQLRVRVSIANSIHEMAAIVGARHTDDDLLPVFHAYREDAFEVRVGLLKHLFEFYRCLSPETRKGMIDALPQFMPMDNSMLNGNWRYRHEFAKQCNKLCEMYGIEEINRTMSAIALTLANDRVSEVRKEAVHLLSQILARLVDHEWSDLVGSVESSDSPTGSTLTELFIQDLVNGFANTQKWTRRQTFAYVCERVLLDHSLSMEQFRFFLLPHLISMATDSVVNVRIAVCRALSHCDSTLQSHAIASDSKRLTPLTVKTVLDRLANDDDMDVARAARLALGQTVGSETVDISMRGFRIREKENAMLDSQLVDDYEENDMSLCSDYSENSLRMTQAFLPHNSS
uniref:HEAT domain containing protein n=2 Tax=Haemonchus contortus TaxID=6289 RepID=A0A7I4XYW5_HAECO|nr:HEAT domain containing protein [Haemonchus contortus]